MFLCEQRSPEPLEHSARVPLKLKGWKPLPCSICTLTYGFLLQKKPLDRTSSASGLFYTHSMKVTYTHKDTVTEMIPRGAMLLTTPGP